MRKINGYKIFAWVIFILSVTGAYNIEEEINDLFIMYFTMISIAFFFMYGIGEIIALLRSINTKLTFSLDNIK